MPILDDLPVQLEDLIDQLGKPLAHPEWRVFASTRWCYVPGLKAVATGYGLNTANSVKLFLNAKDPTTRAKVAYRQPPNHIPADWVKTLNEPDGWEEFSATQIDGPYTGKVMRLEKAIMAIMAVALAAEDKGNLAEGDLVSILSKLKVRFAIFKLVESKGVIPLASSLTQPELDSFEAETGQLNPTLLNSLARGESVTYHTADAVKTWLSKHKGVETTIVRKQSRTDYKAGGSQRKKPSNEETILP